MIRRGNFLVGRGNRSVGPDQHRRAPWPCGIGVAYTECDRCRLIQIAAKIVRKAEFLLKRAVVFGAVEADAQDDRILVGESLDSITEPFTLRRSPRGIGFRIPPQKNVLSRILVERHATAVLAGHRERRRPLSHRYQWHVNLALLFRPRSETKPRRPSN
jgi:hypothetical protein